jgi:hypothetical protein
MRIGFAALFAMAALLIGAGLHDLPPADLHDYIATTIVVLCIYAAVTYPLRAIVFEGAAVRERSLGRWSTTPLPPRVRVQRGLSIGSIYLVDDATDKLFLNVKREFGPFELRESAIKSWLRAQGRLAEAGKA